MKPKKGIFIRRGRDEIRQSIVNQKLITMQQPKFAVSPTQKLKLLHKSFVQEKGDDFLENFLPNEIMCDVEMVGYVVGNIWQASNWMICYQSYSQFSSDPKGLIFSFFFSSHCSERFGILLMFNFHHKDVSYLISKNIMLHVSGILHKIIKC